MATTPTLQFDDLYALDRRLQSGSYGTVHVCQDVASKQEYAVKVIDREKLKKKEENDIQREISILKELEGCDGVIQFVRFFESMEKYHLVMELASGGDLFDKLCQSKNCYTEQDAHDVAFQLLDSMQHLHSKNIVHRDLKPENLLLVVKQDGASVVKLADFGFATRVTKEGTLSTRCGTPSYIAPEILVGTPYTKAVDVWSTGVVLYMILVGYPPFQARNHRELFRKIRSADFMFINSDWKEVSLEAKQLITKLLTVNPHYRITINDAIQSSWIQNSQSIQLDKRDLRSSISRIETFRAREKLKGAIHATHWAMTAKFWNTDKVTFNKQLHQWDKMFEESDGSGVPRKRVVFDNVYELKNKIQKGSMATVWECVHKENQNTYAVKIVEREGLTPRDDEDVLNEVAVLKSLHHYHNIVQLVDFFEEDDRFYVVMEYMEGGDVFDRIIHRKKYTERDARDLARVLLQTVQYIHSQGVAHRDLKPQNLLLKSKDQDSDIRVADFGFAKRVHTPQSLVTRCGTPMYVAPEILKNLPHDQSVDMWSVGAIIYVLLVGYPPFGGENRKELFKNVRSGQYKFHQEQWAHVSEEAKDLIRGLLVLDPLERMTAEQALKSEWITEDGTELGLRELSLDDFKKGSKFKKLATTVKWMSVKQQKTPVHMLGLPPTQIEEEGGVKVG